MTFNMSQEFPTVSLDITQCWKWRRVQSSVSCLYMYFSPSTPPNFLALKPSWSDPTHSGIHPKAHSKLQAMVYDILPSTTAVFSYAIGSRKLSANEQFFVGAQTVVSLLQTTQIKQGVSFIAANKVYTSTNETTIVWIETEPVCFCVVVFYPGWMRLMFTCVLWR